MKPSGSYQFENLESREIEAQFLAERAQLRLDGFSELLARHGLPATEKPFEAGPKHRLPPAPEAGDNLRPAGKILEVGTGHGIRARLLAEHAPAFQVIGIDRSPELIARGKSQEMPPNLTFMEANLYDMPFEDESFDFIYARLVFMHLTDPLHALRCLKRVLKPGGRILIEDADRDCMFFEPAPKSFPDFWRKVQEGQRRLGGNPNVGRSLAPYMKEIGMSDVRCEVQTILGNGTEIEFLARTLMPSLNIYLDPADRPHGEAAIKDLHSLANDPRASFYHFWFAVSGMNNDEHR